MPEATYVPPEQQSAEDLRYMREALAMAQEAFDAAEIPVGSVFVRQGKIIAKARNRTNELMNVSARVEREERSAACGSQAPAAVAAPAGRC